MLWRERESNPHTQPICVTYRPRCADVEQRKNAGNSVYVYRFITSPVAPYRGADGLGGPHGWLTH